jgi:hypothetical protein
VGIGTSLADLIRVKVVAIFAQAAFSIVCGSLAVAYHTKALLIQVIPIFGYGANLFVGGRFAILYLVFLAGEAGGQQIMGGASLAAAGRVDQVAVVRCLGASRESSGRPQKVVACLTV